MSSYWENCNDNVIRSKDRDTDKQAVDIELVHHMACQKSKISNIHIWTDQQEVDMRFMKKWFLLYGMLKQRDGKTEQSKEKNQSGILCYHRLCLPWSPYWRDGICPFRTFIRWPVLKEFIASEEEIQASVIEHVAQIRVMSKTRCRYDIDQQEIISYRFMIRISFLSFLIVSISSLYYRYRLDIESSSVFSHKIPRQT
jgi:hypothetical protein